MESDFGAFEARTEVIITTNLIERFGLQLALT